MLSVQMQGLNFLDLLQVFSSYSRSSRIVYLSVRLLYANFQSSKLLLSLVIMFQRGSIDQAPQVRPRNLSDVLFLKKKIAFWSSLNIYRCFQTPEPNRVVTAGKQLVCAMAATSIFHYPSYGDSVAFSYWKRYYSNCLSGCVNANGVENNILVSYNRL